MPVYRVSPRQPTNEDDVFWVYGIDDWDARDQIAAALGFDTLDETHYACEEDASVLVALNHVAHKDGSFTVCPTPDASDFNKVIH